MLSESSTVQQGSKDFSVTNAFSTLARNHDPLVINSKIPSEFEGEEE